MLPDPPLGTGGRRRREANLADSPSLPGCDELFLRYFDRWYEADDRERKGVPATRPDVIRDVRPGTRPDQVCALTPDSCAQVAARIARMQQAVRGDWPRYLKTQGEISPAWIDAFDRHYNRTRIAAVIARSTPTDFSNDYLVLCCELGAAIGYVLNRAEPQLPWVYEWPYWESCLLDVPSGNRIHVFHWAIKKFSDYGAEDGLEGKLRCCRELVRSGWRAPRTT
ncbi:MAG: hypothetical protein HZA54_03130 [Planctomycetes bacterium]|nr:hypothetical protein [Planctomycetota bacterium]